MSPRVFAFVALVAASLALVLQWTRSSARRRSLDRIAAIDVFIAGGRYPAAADAIVAALGAEKDAATRAALRRRLARVMAAREEYDSAARLCAEAAAEAGGADERAAALVERARCLALAGAFPSAAESLEQARQQPPAPEARLDVDLVAADLALCAGRFDEAERALASAFEAAGRGPRAPEVGLGHARLQFARGNFRQCVAEVGRIVEDLPNDDLRALALVTLARGYLELEHPDVVQAEEAIGRAGVIVHHRGTAALVGACQALVHAHFGHEAEALQAASSAPSMTTSPRFAGEAHHIAGRALLKISRIGEARTHFQSALALDTEQPEALWGLGECARAFGLFEIAESYYRMCVGAAGQHFAGQRAESALGE